LEIFLLEVKKKYTNKILEQEFVAEFEYRPTACKQTYRMVVLRKQVRVMQGQQKLFDDSPYFFYITNLPATVRPQQVVAEANSRCNQESIIAQGKEMGALAAPLNDLMSNWAYMVMALLAWNLKCRLSLSINEAGNGAARAARRAEKRKLLGLDFSTFRQSLIEIPAQILSRGRRLIDCLLTWTPSLETLFRLQESVRQPLLE